MNMANRIMTISYFSISVILFALMLVSCNHNNESIDNIQYDILGQYVTGYTAANMSIDEEFRFVFNDGIDTSRINPLEIIDITPTIEGKAYWYSDHEIRFRPIEYLEPATDYTVNLDLSKIYIDIKNDMKSIDIPINTKAVNIKHNITKIVSAEAKDQMEVIGSIVSNMPLENTWIENKLKIVPPNSNIEWTHSNNRKNHTYTLKKIKRENTSNTVEISIPKGNYIGHFTTKLDIPKVGDFSLIRMDKASSGQGLRLIFSERLDLRQDVKGLVFIEGYKDDISLSIIDNELKIEPKTKIIGTKKITVSKELVSTYGNKLDKPIEIEVSFERVKPEIKVLGEGVIAPDASNVIFPFEAIGLEAVDVEIFKIYSNNMLQFLEDNTLSDLGYRLEGVGNIIHQQKIDLSSIKANSSIDQWHRYAIDVSKLTELDKSSLYQIRIGYRRAYTSYKKVGDEDIKIKKDEYGQIKTLMKYARYRYTDDYDSNNPANIEYYGQDKFLKRNLLSSNIGINAKLAKDHKLHIMTADILSANPISGVEVNVYNYQKQLDQVAYTNSEGMIIIDANTKPAYIIAKHNKDATYLSLQDYRANSLTDFDVSGRNKIQGIDGYIYGERGVWRPGDTLHLTFVLEDKNNKLPTDHPIVLTVTDPKGTQQFRKTTTQHIFGMYTFNIPTEASDPTGKWKANIEVGDQVFSKNLQVETIKPNRIKMDYPYISDKLKLYNKQDLVLEADWLHGANASSLNATVDMQLSATNTTFDQYKSYTFDDPARKLDRASTQIFDGVLDVNGKAKISIPSNKNLLAPGKLKVSLKTKVFEKSGNFSEDNLSFEADPYESYVGVKVPTTRWGSKKIDLENNEPIDIVILDIDGNPIKNRKLKIGLYNARWRWWYNRRDNNLYSYNSSQHFGAIDTITLYTDANGTAKWQTDLTQYGSHMVRVCDQVSGHCSGDLFYAGYSWHREQGSNNEGASLRFTTDKKTYNTGEKIKVNMPSNKGARILVSLENNSSVVREYWVEADENETNIEIPVTQEMTPNIYIHLTMIQSYSNRKNDLPLRMYGVSSVAIDNPEARLYPEIEMASAIKPSADYTIEVSESNGDPMAYTLAVVDEGLLDLTRFKTPSLYDHFYTKQSLGVKTWDIYDHILNGYGAEIEKVISIGGDGEISKDASAAKANRFKPVVHFSGPHFLKKGEDKKHSLNMSNYVGAVRVMVVGVNDRAYGNAEKSVPVKSELMVLPTLPRVLAPGEKLSLPVSVFSMNDAIKDVSVNVSSSNNVNWINGNTQMLTFSQQGDQLSSFDFTVDEKIGVEEFKINANSGKYKASQKIEIDVRNPNPLTTEFIEEVLAKNEEGRFNFNTKGTEGTNELSLEVSTIPAINLDNRLKYLMRYPYGCVEQTVSSVFPQIYLENFSDLTQVKKTQIERNVQAGILRLKSFHRSDGGFSYWPGNPTGNDWGTSYAGHFLISAADQGYYVPNEMINTWINYQTEASNSFKGNMMQQAYRLYTLALAGQPNWSAMNRLKSSGTISDTPSLLLAAAYAIGGQDSVAEEIRSKTMNKISYEPTGNGYTYGSVSRNKALATQALLHISDDNNSAKLVQELAKDLGSNRWYSTQSTAMTLLAISQYLGDNAADGMEYEVTVSGSQPLRKSTDKSISTLPIDIEKLKAGEITIKNHSSRKLFARLLHQYKPEMGVWKSESKNLNIKVRYTDMQGQTIDPKNIQKGKDFIIETTISNPSTRLRNLKDLALHQVFPSGWEIQNSRISGRPNAVKNDAYDYQDIRDDRIYTFFGINGKSSKTFRSVLTATYPGEYYLPDYKCEAMYDQEIRARYAGSKVIVSR